MSTESLAVEAVLVAEFARGRTRTYLLDLVEGEHRFLARGEAVSTLQPPTEDLTIGLQAAVQQIEHTTGRQLLKRDRLVMPQVANGDGIDAFIALANVGDPLRVAVLDAGGSEAEIAAITDVLRRMEALVLAIVPPARGVRPAEWANQQAAALATLQPDLVLLLAGASANTESLTRMLGLIKSVAGQAVDSPSRLAEARAQVHVWAITNDAIYGQVADQLATRANLRSLTGLAPAALAERLMTDLARLVEDRHADTVYGYEALTGWASGPVVSRQRGANLSAHYLARTGARRVGLADLEETVGLHVAWPDRVTAATVADADLGLHAANLLSLCKPASVRRWLPFEVSDEDLTHWALNRALRPLTMAITLRDQLIEQAFAREALHLASERLGAGLARTPEWLIGTQSCGRWHAPGAAAAVLLDGVQPAPELGIVTLALDHLGILPALGALAQSEPAIAAGVLERDGLHVLGTCLVIQGGADGQRVASVTVRREDGATQEADVRSGAVVVLPLAADEATSIRLTLENKASLGTFRSGQTVQFETPTHLRGGPVGLIIDARGRPLHWPEDGRRRQERVREWLKAFGVVPATGLENVLG